MFADDYARFIDLSEDEDGEASPEERQRQRNRLNERHEALITANRDILDGARVVDLAGHDGRYSFAALRAGAAHATLVEARQSLIDRAQGAFAHYGQDPATYRFVCGDVFDVLAGERLEADVAFSFGFLYHTYRHTEFLHGLHRIAPRYLVMDTMVTLDPKPTLKLIRERDAEDNRSAFRDPWSVGRVLVLRPSLPALELMLHSYGFEVESMHDWPGQLRGRTHEPGVRGYATGKRVTLRCKFRKAAVRERWRPTLAAPDVAGRDAVARGAVTAPTTPTGWRGKVNQALASATGYQLRRVPKD